MKNSELKVSIIIPIYNAEKFLEQCLNSITAQTYRNIEIICIDDGSNDSSLKILDKYVEKDNRFIVLRQQNQGAAVARNKGIEIAKGKYIIFFDSDDYFNNDLINKALNKAEKYNADIVIFKAIAFDSTTGRRRYLNDKIDNYKMYFNKTFSVDNVADNIFNSFLLAPWNKFYRTDFIKENALYFQNIKRSNDIYFTTTSLVKAAKIILMNDVLTYYRKGINTNLQSGNDKSPLEFFKALAFLKKFLEKENLYQLTKESFTKLALETTFYNIYSLKNKSVKLYLVQFMNEKGFKALGIINSKKIYALNLYLYLMFKMTENYNLFIFNKLYFVFKIQQYFPKFIKNILNMR